MKDNFVVGNVISVDGLKVIILMNEQSNLESFHYKGEIYDGISVGSYVGIVRGSNTIIGRVEKEYVEDKSRDPLSREFSKDRFERRVEVSLIGFFRDGKFEFGIKRFPMIYNEVILLTEEDIGKILQGNFSASNNSIVIGTSVPHNVPVKLSWNKLFNTHIGIFGNTGSGKSNTLAKIFTELFNLEGNGIIDKFNLKSTFFLLDFNGEYTGEKILRNNKKCIKLNTHNKLDNDDNNKIPLDASVFWDVETLSILYSATEKTQKPFLKNAINYFLDKKEMNITSEKIIEGLCSAFSNLFSNRSHKETLGKFNKCLDMIEFKSETCKYADVYLEDILESKWHSKNNAFYNDYPRCTSSNSAIYFDSIDKGKVSGLRDKLKDLLENNYKNIIDSLTVTEKLAIAVNCQIIYVLSYGNINYDHISPLIQRIESRSKLIEKTICILNNGESEKRWNILNIISFEKCNIEAKKTLPLLIVKQLYDNHKKKKITSSRLDSTLHLIIDEAHNILSEQSTREAESWKDYRLEVFEEIIKEGRKFGFYITLASQRPCDISNTIVSQVHNYFIHRLVNEFDLRMINNTINSLDSVSKKQIPNLAAGQCIVTGTSFELPLLVQVEKLSQEKSPLSDNADLIRLWKEGF